MAKFVFLSEEMDSMATQCRLIAEGHEVKTYVKLPDHRDIGKGIITIIPNWESQLSWGEYWIADSNCFGKECEYLRKLKKKVFGGNRETDKTEDDRAFGLSLLENHGIDCGIWCGPFTAEKAIEFITENPKRFVIKPNGSLDKDLTFCSKSSEDAIEFLKENKSKYKGELILQEFVEDAKELAIGVTVQRGQILLPARENAEHKSLNEGGRGPATGETGTILHYTFDSPLLDEIQKLTPWLEEMEYTGDYDLNFMIQKDGTPICLEATARPGYPISIFQCDNIDMEYGEYLISLIEGQLDNIPIKNNWSCGVCVFAPGFPFKEAFRKHSLDRHIEQIEEIYEPGFYLYCMNQDNKGYMTAGNYGLISVAVANKNTLKSCVNACYSLLEKKDLPRWLAWRTDIGADLLKGDLLTLQNLGYLLD